MPGTRRKRARHKKQTIKKHAKAKKYNVIWICHGRSAFNDNTKILPKTRVQSMTYSPAVFLANTKENRQKASRLQTVGITKQMSRLRKYGCILAHQKALEKAVRGKMKNILILEEDATLSRALPAPPKQPCYMGGWIVPKNISETGTHKVKVPSLSTGLQTIDYETFQIIMSHSYFLPSYTDAKDIVVAIKTAEKIRNYDIFLARERFMHHFYYPPCFVQGKHVSEIDGKVNKNDAHTLFYGLKE